MTRLPALKPIPEPVPVEEHIYCAICEVKFNNFLEHVRSSKHAACTEIQSFPDIDDVIKELGEVQPM